jgi:hypothetical protein
MKIILEVLALIFAIIVVDFLIIIVPYNTLILAGLIIVGTIFVAYLMIRDLFRS